MMFNSIGFIVFFIVIYYLLWLMNHYEKLNDKSNIALLVISLIFYALFDIRCLILLLIVIFFTYYLGLRIKKNKKYLKIGIVLNVILLGFFKYFNFFINSFANLFGSSIALNIILPIGISFYIFKSISYLVDVYRDKCPSEKDIVALALYISFFPEIVAGPISRAKNLLNQVKKTRQLHSDNLFKGAQIFVFGLFKKIVIADNISVFVSEVYRAPNIYSSLTIFLCVIAYSVEIYMDFSGYSDMAIGISKILGFEIERNFNLPYISKNVTEFWRRWHITLSTWLKDYIYIPLGGNKAGKNRQYINLLITMIIGGLWHGANWTFILWGFVNGLALVIHKIYADKHKNKGIPALSIVLTFIFISLTWVLFRADNFTNAKDIFVGLFSFRKGIDFISSWAIFGIALTLISNIFAYFKNNKNAYYPNLDLNTIKGLFLFFLLIGLTIGLAYTGNNPFIYAAF